MTIDDFRQIVADVIDERLLNHSEIESKKREAETCWLTAKEVCKKLGICLSTLDNWVKQGKVIRHKVGRRVYYLKSEIDKLIKG